MKFGQIKYRKRFCLFRASLCFVWLFLGIIPIKLAIAHYQAPYPQAILTLGGSPDREEFTAQFAQINPSLDIWVSTGVPAQQAWSVFRTAKIAGERVHLDYRATDTVTNFTTLVKDFKHEGIQHLYLITSSFHMPRSMAIAMIVLGSQGITFTPVPVPSRQKPEPKIEIWRDSFRSLFWLFTGRTGASLKNRK